MDRDANTDEAESSAATEGKSPSPESDGHPRWRVTLYTMWLAQSFCIMGFSFVMPFMPFYVRELGVTEERMVAIWAGLLGTGSGLAMATMGPVWGWVADRYGRKMMVQRAMFGGSVVLSLMGLAKSAPQLLALRIIQGGITGTVPASVALVSSVVPKARLGASLGLMQMAVFSGGSIGPYLGGIVADRFGYQVPFGVTGALLFTGGMLVLFGAKERFVRPAPEQREQAAPLRVLFRSEGLLVLLLVYTSMNLSGSLVMPIFPLFVEKIMGTPEQAAAETGLLLAVTGVAAAVSAVMVGRLSDRMGHKTVLIACTAIAGVMCFPQAAAQSVGQLVVMRALFGLGAGGMIPAMNAMIATVVPRQNIGQAYGFTTTFSALGWATGPALGGWLASELGYRLPFVITGAMLLLVTLAQYRGLRAGPSD
jgi:DHA1 family multidrug resistance protein-like MFS transporter